MSLEFETMKLEHSKSVMEIFNHYIEHSSAAYPESPLPEAAFRLFSEKIKGYAGYVVVDTELDQVIGFCLLHAYSPFTTFKHSAEVSYFLSPDQVGKSIGALVLERLEKDARKLGITRLLANISSENLSSLAFHRKHGFSECGTFHQIGRKHGRTFDVVWMEKMLD